MPESDGLDSIVENCHPGRLSEVTISEFADREVPPDSRPDPRVCPRQLGWIGFDPDQGLAGSSDEQDPVAWIGYQGVELAPGPVEIGARQRAPEICELEALDDLPHALGVGSGPVDATAHRTASELILPLEDARWDQVRDLP